MTCADFEKFVSAFVDGELDAPTLREFEQHAAGCGRCAAELDGERTVKRVVRAQMRRIVPPADLREKIRASLDRVDAAPRARRRAWIVPVAAAAAIVGLWLGPLQIGDGNVGTASLIGNIADVHAKNLPVEVRSDNPSDVAGWFHGKVDFPVHPPKLAKRARLVGARLGHIGDREAALMTYETTDGRRMTFIQWIADRPIQDGRTIRVANRTLRVGQSKGYSTAILRRGQVTTVLVSDFSQSENAQMAAQVGW